MSHVESAPKLTLDKSMAMLEDGPASHPGRLEWLAASAGRTTSSSVSIRSSSPRQGRAHLRCRRQRSTSTCSAPTGRSSSATSEPEINRGRQEAHGARLPASASVQPVQNELEERLANTLPCGEQTIIVKTGSDATNAAVRAMRAATGRDVIARCGYHGWGDWCVEHHGGVPQAVVDLTKEFAYGRRRRPRARVRREPPARWPGVMITPVGHPLAAPVIPPPDGYLQAVVDLCTRTTRRCASTRSATGFRRGRWVAPSSATASPPT